VEQSEPLSNPLLQDFKTLDNVFIEIQLEQKKAKTELLSSNNHKTLEV